MSYLENIVHKGSVAVITGAASGIGLAAAKYFASKGMNLFLADINEPLLSEAAKSIKQIPEVGDVVSLKVDVSDLKQVEGMRDRVNELFGEVSVLLNNAASFQSAPTFSSSKPVSDLAKTWKESLSVSFDGVLYGSMVFAPLMVQQENFSVIINTGSKQGITMPPGNAAYNTGKAAVRAFTEQLQHDLRNVPESKCSAHLFVPGWTHTGDRSRSTEKPPGAWSAEQTVAYLVERLSEGDFYIIVPDNETSTVLDKLRMEWTANDLLKNRPPLSRWHPAYKSAFDEFVRQGQGLQVRSRSRGRAADTTLG